MPTKYAKKREKRSGNPAAVTPVAETPKETPGPVAEKSVEPPKPEEVTSPSKQKTRLFGKKKKKGEEGGE